MGLRLELASAGIEFVFRLAGEVRRKKTVTKNQHPR